MKTKKAVFQYYHLSKAVFLFIQCIRKTEKWVDTRMHLDSSEPAWYIEPEKKKNHLYIKSMEVC